LNPECKRKGSFINLLQIELGSEPSSMVFESLKKDPLNPKGGGGGSKCPIGQEIGSHFSQDHAMIPKILDFIHIQGEGGKVIFLLASEIWPRPIENYDFLRSKITKSIFFQLFHSKIL
jgi:hypothetical protein